MTRVLSMSFGGAVDITYMLALMLAVEIEYVRTALVPTLRGLDISLDHLDEKCKLIRYRDLQISVVTVFRNLFANWF